jgi:hypothetical protein
MSESSVFLERRKRERGKSMADTAPNHSETVMGEEMT